MVRVSDNDSCLCKGVINSLQNSRAESCLKAALPVIALCGPDAGKLIGVARAGTKLGGRLRDLTEAKDARDVVGSVFHASMCMVRIAGSIYGNKDAKRVVALYDLIMDSYDAYASFRDGKGSWLLVIEAVGQGIFTITLFHGSSEIKLLGYGVDALIKFLKALEHFEKGEVFEAVCRLIVGGSNVWEAIGEGEKLYNKFSLDDDPFIAKVSGLYRSMTKF